METLVDFNSAKHAIKHGKSKGDLTKWMSIKEVAEHLGTNVNAAKQLIRKASTSFHLTPIIKPGSRGMAVLYAAETALELKKLYTSGALTRPKSKILNLIPVVGRSIALISVARAVYDSGLGQALAKKLEIKKWERKASEFIQGRARPFLYARLDNLKALGENQADILIQKLVARLNHKAKLTPDAESKLSKV